MAVVAGHRKRRPRKLTDAVLAEVAALYRQHAASGKPAEVIARRFQVSTRSARVYVAKCRERRLLGPAVAGRAGELPPGHEG